MKVTAVRMRYEHIAAGWWRATAERRAGLLGELELLALQLPEMQSLDDSDRAEVVALRAAIGEAFAIDAAGSCTLQDHEGRIDILRPADDGCYDLGGLGWTFRYRDDL